MVRAYKMLMVIIETLELNIMMMIKMTRTQELSEMVMRPICGPSASVRVNVHLVT